MRPPFYMENLTPRDRQVLGRFYGFMAAFYCCVILITVMVANPTADNQLANGLVPVANAIAGNSSAAATSLSTESTIPMAKR